ncbi:protein phosphatase 1-binding protein bifocal isoform X1 [Colletes latitarsis]|uniref:protein phosphatase 1-binding protein bifocal isoform X1 n=1 Tax=Colletes latitarsis TaxID=2605962 RepID=UPI004036BA3D
MATASNATTSAGETGGNNAVPQWKRDLIQRRRQQSKVLASNGASVKLCTAMIGSSATTESIDTYCVQDQCAAGNPLSRPRSTSIGEDNIGVNSVANISSGNVNSGGGNAIAGVVVSSSPFFSRGPASGATVASGTTAANNQAPTVACNMRLEADLSLCSDSEDVANGTLSKSSTTDMERKSEHGDGSENEDPKGIVDPLTGCDEHRTGSSTCRTGNNNNKAERDVLAELSRTKAEMSRNRAASDDGESDSSEELQYGPGIVNKLKSKYLNLTLREMNKSRATVQRFRRAASLEDLLDCDDEPGEKSARKYAKRATTGASAKTDRYRNASRGNESMKRARSVETLMRCNGTEDPGNGRLAANGLKQELANDHIILIDRTTVKIESRLNELDRPKPVNKPKRIKPLLAETERPPPDLVKTTMRIFEGSAKKLRPRGEVAAKVATFKTINDTFKAQAQKKIVAKPPVQPKPFVNGNSRPAPGSPKKIVLPQKPTAELIETQLGQEEYHIDGVITDPIVQSVSSVVSKFQQIEKSHSPSPSPEPSFKLKFSPVASPEPPLSKLKSSLEINVKSPPVTPVLSPRIASPRLQSPSSPMKDTGFRQYVHSPPSPIKDPPRRNSSPVHHKPPASPSRELLKQMSSPETPKPPRPQTEETPTTMNNGTEHPRQQLPERVPSPTNRDAPEESKSLLEDLAPSEESQPSEEEVDAPKTISKTALENIARTGVTMQFSFSDKPSLEKSYLPGYKQNGQKPTDDQQPDARNETNSSEPRGKSFLAGDDSMNVVAVDQEAVSRLQERLEPDKCDRKIEDAKEDVEPKPIVESNKPIGAICSLGLIKSSTTASYPQINESKTIRCQKTSESPPQKQIGIIRPLVSTKTQHLQQNLSNRELEKNLINRVKSIEQPTKVVVSLKSADEIQPPKKTGTGGGGLWETKPWNQQNNTMVFNFSNRKDVPDYIENDGLIIKRKREKPKVGDGGIIVLGATLDASTTDDAEWELAGGPPSPCDVSFFNDNVLINGRSNLSRTPRNHKHRIQFDDTATRTFEYPSEGSMLEGESSVDDETSGSVEQSAPISNKTSSSSSPTSMPTLLGGGGLASYTPSKVDLTSEGFELGVTRAVSSSSTPTSTSTTPSQPENEITEVDYLKPAQDAGAWGSETTGDLLY